MTRVAARSMVASDGRGSDGELALATQIRWTGLVTPEREFRFDRSRRWRLDFAFVEQRIAVEVEGGSWIAGRHTRGVGFEADLEKYNALALAGWLLLRVTPAMISDGRAIRLLERALKAKAAA